MTGRISKTLRCVSQRRLAREQNTDACCQGQRIHPFIQEIKNGRCLISLKLKLIHHASIHPIHFGEFSFSPMYGQISRNDAFGRCGCLP